MSGKDILNELDGKVSGETRELYQTFHDPAKSHIEELSKDLHKVIGTGEANGQTFAIIEKINTNVSITGEVEGKNIYLTNKRKIFKTDRSYFLTGINDEGTYFVHPLDNDSVKTWWRTGDMQQVLDGVNRTHDGFVRIQGDVLVKEYAEWELIIGDQDSNGVEDITLDEHNEHMNLVDRDVEGQLKLQEARREMRLEQARLGYDLPSMWDPPAFGVASSSRITYVNGVKKAFDLDTGDAIDVTEEEMKSLDRFSALDMTMEEYTQEYVKHEASVNSSAMGGVKLSKHELTNPLPLFGNHFLYTDAKKIYAGEQGVLLREATVVVLEHNEHKTVKFSTNPKTNTFLTTQRGVTAIEGKFVGYD